MFASAATINPAVIAPPQVGRTHLLRPHPSLSWSSRPRQLFKRHISSNTSNAFGWETSTSVKTAVAAVDSSESAEKAISTYEGYNSPKDTSLRIRQYDLLGRDVEWKSGGGLTYGAGEVIFRIIISYGDDCVRLPPTKHGHSLYRFSCNKGAVINSPNQTVTALTSSYYHLVLSKINKKNPPSIKTLQQVQQEARSKYYFLVANAKFMLDEEEHFQEQLFERIRLFEERNQEQDFWLVIEPKFLEKFPNITKRLKRPAVALVSTNGTWITFMKLRLDRVLTESFEAGSIEEALAYNPVKIEFEKPANWVAPYPKYESGWWEPFLPPVPEQPKA